MPPWGCLPWDRAVGLERQGEKAQKSKRSKKGPNAELAPYRVYAHSSVEASGYTSWVQGELVPAAALTGASVPHQGLVMRCQRHL